MPRPHPREPRRGRGIVTGEPGALKGARRVRRKAARKRPAPAIAGHGTSPRSPSGSWARTPAPATARRWRREWRFHGPGPGDRTPRHPGGTGRVRRAGHPDRPAGHHDRPRGPARRARRARPGRPLAGPRPGHRRRGQPQDHLVRDRHRRAWPRRRARLRPARTQESQEAHARPARETGFTFTPASRDGPPDGYGTWRLHTPGTGPDLMVTLDSLTTRTATTGRKPGPRSRRQAEASGPGPARHLHQPGLPATRHQCDFEHNTPYEAGGRTCLCNGGPNVATTTGSNSTPVDGRPAPRRHLPVDHPGRATYTTEPTRYPITGFSGLAA